jgi:dTDP-4-dehydrorhamnose reductase
MPVPRLLVTGGAGLVGGSLIAAAAPRCSVHATRHRSPGDVAAATWHALDVVDPDAARALVGSVRPDVVVHAAMDVAPAALVPVTVDGAANVAAAAHDAGAALVHLSSDMVFDGAGGPYDEAVEPSPITEYGRAKAEAERRVRAAHPAAVIVRLPLLYRLEPPDRGLAAWLAAAREGRAHPLFVDEFRRPACVVDVAEALVRIVLALARPGAGPQPPPVVHLPGPALVSRHAFGAGVLEALGLSPALAVAGKSADSPVPRPRVLDFVAVATPPEFVAPLRPPAEVFSAVRRAAAPPMPQAGPPAAR